MWIWLVSIGLVRTTKKALICYISRLYRTISYYIKLEFGGDNRDRTDDLLNAIFANLYINH
nr:MAG TPA: hypothetical protein [Caudoviricetes sp.]